jgi:serine/threonine protein kinase, bacterial
MASVPSRQFQLALRYRAKPRAISSAAGASVCSKSGGLAADPARVYRKCVKPTLGLILALAFLSACGGDRAAGTLVNVFPTPAVRFIYATNSGTNAVLLFGGNTPGNAVPKQTLAGSLTQLDNPSGLAFSGSGVLYVANRSSFGNGAITVYPGFTGGNIAPLFFIRGNLTQLTDPSMIALDPSAKVFVTNPATNSIVAFASGLSGNVYPSSWIQGNVTALSEPNGIALDGSGNMFVANTGDNAIRAYAPVSTTSVAANEPPYLTISGANTGLNGPFGLAMDSVGRLWVSNEGNDTIEVFAQGSFGNAAPMFIYSGASTHLSAPREIWFNSFGQLYVANADAGSGSIEVFALLPFPLPGNGNVSPTLLITGAATQLTAPIGVTAH